MQNQTDANPQLGDQKPKRKRVKMDEEGDEDEEDGVIAEVSESDKDESD